MISIVNMTLKFSLILLELFATMLLSFQKFKNIFNLLLMIRSVNRGLILLVCSFVGY